MRPLSDTRRRILGVLARRNVERDGCPTAREIARWCGEDHRASDWATVPLRGMLFDGLVVRMGVAFNTSARTWAITDAGRAAYEAASARKAEAAGIPVRRIGDGR